MFLDYLWFRLKHLDSVLRLKAVMDLDRQDLLIKIAKKDSVPLVRACAVGRITDQSALKGIAFGDADYLVREAAVGRLTDQEALKAFASEQHDALRKAVTAKPEMFDGDAQSNKVMGLKSKCLFYKLTDKEEQFLRAMEFKRIALERISEQSFLAEYAKSNNIWSDVAVDGIIDQAILEDIAVSSPSKKARVAAIKKCRSQPFLARLVTNPPWGGPDRDETIIAVDGITDQAILEDIASLDLHIDLREAAIKKIASQSFLKQLAMTSPDYFVSKYAQEGVTGQTDLEDIARSAIATSTRSYAVDRIENHALLVELAKNCSEEDWQVADSTVRRITDQTDLEDIASSAISTLSRIEAIRRITNCTFLVDLVKSCSDETVRAAAVKRISACDQGASPCRGELYGEAFSASVSPVQIARTVSASASTSAQHVELWINSHLDRIIAEASEPSLIYAQQLRSQSNIRSMVVDAAVRALTDVATDRREHHVELDPVTWELGNLLCMVSAFPCDSIRDIRHFYESSMEKSYVGFLSVMTVVGSNVFLNRPFCYMHWLFALNERGGGAVTLMIFRLDPTQGPSSFEWIVTDNALL